MNIKCLIGGKGGGLKMYDVLIEWPLILKFTSPNLDKWIPISTKLDQTRYRNRNPIFWKIQTRTTSRFWGQYSNLEKPKFEQTWLIASELKLHHNIREWGHWVSDENTFSLVITILTEWRKVSKILNGLYCYLWIKPNYFLFIKVNIGLKKRTSRWQHQKWLFVYNIHLWPVSWRQQICFIFSSWFGQICLRYHQLITSWETMAKCIKSCESIKSMPKAEKVWESVPKAVKVWQILPKAK